MSGGAQAIQAAQGRCVKCGEAAGIVPLFGMPMGEAVMITFICGNLECRAIISTQFIPMDWLPAPVRASLDERIAAMLDATASSGPQLVEPGMDDINPNLRKALDQLNKRRTQ